MKNFYIIANTRKEPAVIAARRLQTYLQEQGKTCEISPTGDGEGDTFRYTDARLVPENTECVLVLGGDGTLLQASRDLVGTGLPLLGINLGTLGYLAEIGMGDAYDALDRLIRDQYTQEMRMMLTGTVIRGGKKLLDDIALNDIVIGRRGPLKVIDFTIYVDETLLCSYRADGIIVSTPTGSTGYSLSAGGPIVAPDASLMLLTAVAPHTLNSRTIVLPDHVEITVSIDGKEPPSAGELPVGSADVSFDGDTSLRLLPGDRIRVRKAELSTQLVKIHNTSFVENLRHKMG